MIALFTTPQYTSTFISINLLGSDIRATLWQFGKPRGHICYSTCFEAVHQCARSGFVLATPQMKEVFENDVLIGED